MGKGTVNYELRLKVTAYIEMITTVSWKQFNTYRMEEDRRLLSLMDESKIEEPENKSSDDPGEFKDNLEV